MSVRSRVIAAARARPWAVAIVAIGLIISAVPFTNATHLGTGGGDIRFDASLWTSASFDGTYIGQQNVETMGANAMRATPYELQFTNISAANQTRVELHSPTGSVVTSTDLAVGPDGPGGSLRNATFLVSSGTLVTTGLYRLTYMGGNTTVGAMFVHPTRDITVTTSPSTIQYAANSSMVMTVSTGVANAMVRGQNIPPPGTTDANGNFTFLASIPPPGTYIVEAWKDLGGDNLPERIGATTYTVTTDAAHLTQRNLQAPASSTVGTPVNVSVTVENDGSASGTGTVVFLINNAQRENRNVTLAPGQMASINFTFTPTVAGTYSVTTRLGNHTLPAQNITVAQPGLTVNVAPSIISVGSFHDVIVNVSDAYGNRLTNAHVELLRADGSPTTSDDFQGARSIDGTGAPGSGQDGTYRFTLSAQHNGDYSFRATVGSVSGSAPFMASSPTPCSSNPSTCPPPPCAEPECAYNFRIWDVRASSLVPTVAPIRMGNMTNFGSATLTLSYDPSVVEVTNVTNGNVPNSTLTWSVNASQGRVTLLLTTTARPGTNGDHDFARVSFRAVGTLGSTSPLDLTVIEAVDSEGNDFTTPALVGDATFRAGLLGDADGDGDIDAQDAIVIAEAVVGRRSMASLIATSADVSGDGLVTGRDAMLIQQFLAGTRASL